MANFKLSAILALCRVSHVVSTTAAKRREGSVASSSCLSLRVMDGVNLT
jgi:hypothetical protein